MPVTRCSLLPEAPVERDFEIRGVDGVDACAPDAYSDKGCRQVTPRARIYASCFLCRRGFEEFVQKRVEVVVIDEPY